MPLGPMRTKAQKREGVHTVMGEYKRGTLHSGSKTGPVVKSRAQAIAIALKQTGQSKYQQGGEVSPQAAWDQSLQPSTVTPPPQSDVSPQSAWQQSITPVAAQPQQPQSNVTYNLPSAPSEMTGMPGAETLPAAPTSVTSAQLRSLGLPSFFAAGGDYPNTSYQGRGQYTSDLVRGVPQWLQPQIPQMLRDQSLGQYNPAGYFDARQGYVIPPTTSQGREFQNLWRQMIMTPATAGDSGGISHFNLDRWGRFTDPYIVSAQGGRINKYARGGSPLGPLPLGKMRPLHWKGFRHLDKGGFINSDVPGRTDKHYVTVRSGSYVLPADHVSALGQNNSVAGARVVRDMFAPGSRFGPRLSIPKFAGGGSVEPVPIVVAGGEVILPPDVVRRIGGGDMAKGHATLDKWVLATRDKHISKLKSLKPPKGS